MKRTACSARQTLIYETHPALFKPEAGRRELIEHLVELYNASGKADAAVEWTKRIKEVSRSVQRR